MPVHPVRTGGTIGEIILHIMEINEDMIATTEDPAQRTVIAPVNAIPTSAITTECSVEGTMTADKTPVPTIATSIVPLQTAESEDPTAIDGLETKDPFPAGLGAEAT